MSLPTPPSANRIRHTLTEHGRTRTDDYFWLRERDNPDVIAYLEAENAYTRAMTAHTHALQATLFAEMKGRIQDDDLDVPEQIDDWLYYGRTEAGKQYKLHCRRRGSMNAQEEILLDENALATGHVYCRIGVFEVSPDHRWLAYAYDFDGDEVYTLVIKNLDTGELLPEQIENTYYDAVWANDNRTLFYKTLDHAKRPYRVHRHVVGEDPSNDALIFEERDETFSINLKKTADKRFIVVQSNSAESSEAHFVSADMPAQPPRVIEPRTPKLEYSANHAGDRWFIDTNADGATNFKLVTAPTDAPGRANWRDFLPYNPTVNMWPPLLFKNHVVLWERAGGLAHFRIVGVDGEDARSVAFPEAAYEVWPHFLHTYDTHILRFTYQSPITPEQVVDYNLRDGTSTVRKQKEIPSGYDKSRYVTERIEATALDGVNVPMTLVYRDGARANGPAPVWLYAYGSYGAVNDPDFDARRLSLLDRGVIYAMAHVRGGGELGRTWYDDGKLLHKKNTFTDFIACAEHLIAQGYTRSDKLVIRGISAGGLLMGAVVTMRPELAHVVVAEVPFVDVISTMFDLSIPLTAGELEQWGDPRNKADYDYMLSYSPYDNLVARSYPHMLVTAGLNDPRVQYWEPAKFVAKLRAMKTDDNTLVLKTHMGAGHSGSSGRYDSLHEEAFKYAFVLDKLGIVR
jgi:oligopeptidase B